MNAWGLTRGVSISVVGWIGQLRAVVSGRLKSTKSMYSVGHHRPSVSTLLLKEQLQRHPAPSWISGSGRGGAEVDRAVLLGLASMPHLLAKIARPRRGPRSRRRQRDPRPPHARSPRPCPRRPRSRFSREDREGAGADRRKPTKDAGSRAPGTTIDCELGGVGFGAIQAGLDGRATAILGWESGGSGLEP